MICRRPGRGASAASRVSWAAAVPVMRPCSLASGSGEFKLRDPCECGRHVTEVLSEPRHPDTARRRFSSLQEGFAFFDAPGGSQVPDEVGDAIARALREASANLGAGYATSHRVKAILEEAESKAARFLGCDPHEIVFGANMSSLNFTLSRTAGRGFEAGDEILVSSLDHDGGVAPWLELAHDRDLVVKSIELRDDTTLEYEDL